MRCFRRNKGSTTGEVKREIENGGSEESNVLRRTLRRVSTLASIIMRFLRDIRKGIYRLFCLTGRVAPSTLSSKEDITEDINNNFALKNGYKVENRLFQLSTEPRAVAHPRRPRRTFMTKASSSQTDYSDTSGAGDETPRETKEKDPFADEIFRTHNNVPGQNVQNVLAFVHTQNVRESVNTNQMETPQSPTLCEGAEARQLGQTSESYDLFSCQTTDNQREMAREILNYIMKYHTTTVTDKMKARVLRALLEETGWARKTHQAKTLTQLSAHFDIHISSSGVITLVEKENLNLPASIQENQTPLQNLVQQQNQSYTVPSEQTIKDPSRPRFLEGPAKHDKAGADTKVALQSADGSMKATQPAVCVEQVPSKQPVLSETQKPASESKVAEVAEAAAKPALPESDAAVKTDETICVRPKTTLIKKDGCAKEAKLELVTDSSQLKANEARFVRMVELVVRHCILAHARRNWRYRMELVVNVHVRPDGRNGWCPLDADGLYAAEGNQFQITSPRVKDVRRAWINCRVSLESYVNRVGKDFVPEDVQQTIQSICRGTTARGQGEVSGEYLRDWMDLLNVMMYISYYTLVCCSRCLVHVELGGREIDNRQHHVRTLQTHVVTKFCSSLKCFAPRMRDAVEFFGLMFEDGDPPVDPISDVCDLPANEAPPQLSVGHVPAQSQALPSSQPSKPTTTKKKVKKRKKKNKSRHRSATSADDATSAADTDSSVQAVGDLAAGGDGVPQPEEATTTTGEQEEGAHEGENAGEVIQDEEDGSLAGEQDGEKLDTMSTVLTADVNRVVEWEFADYVSYIETNNTLDLSCLEVVAGHGERPNKKKLASEMREKIKTKGIPNKHLEPVEQSQEHDTEDATCASGEDFANSDSAVQPEVGDGATGGSEVSEPLEMLDQTLDDREFNLVPEEVIRKDESRLRDVEDAYTLATPDGKRDKHRKRKEKKPKAVKLLLDFEFPDHRRF